MTRSNLTLLRVLLDIVQHRTHLAMYAGIAFREPKPFRGWRWREQHLEAAALDVWRLKVLHDHDDAVHETINRRAAMFERIQECAEGGFVAIYESGMDCDCVTFSGIHRHKVPATLYAVLKEMDAAYAASDGNLSLSIIKPSEAEGVEYKSRDNVMEAYEDGHPHAVVARMP